jgi:hypothetical protein
MRAALRHLDTLARLLALPAGALLLLTLLEIAR